MGHWMEQHCAGCSTRGDSGVQCMSYNTGPDNVACVPTPNMPVPAMAGLERSRGRTPGARGEVVAAGLLADPQTAVAVAVAVLGRAYGGV
jgi:hypothetical protein